MEFVPELPHGTVLTFSALELPLKHPAVFLIRHGERPEGMLSPDVQLTKEGALQSVELGKYFKKLHLDAGFFLSSPYKRCQDTLHNMIKGWGIDPNRFLVVDENRLVHAHYETMREIVNAALNHSLGDSKQLHLMCSHDLMIGNCVRRIFPAFADQGAEWLPGFLEGILWTKEFAIWRGNRISLH